MQTYILAGGMGTRLWPLSTEQLPKQFSDIGLGGTLFAHALARASAVKEVNVTIIGSVQHAALIEDAVSQWDGQPPNTILEPCSRNTALSVAIATIDALKYDAETTVAVFPCDHLIKNTKMFAQDVANAAVAALDTDIVLFGARPNRPATGYGYIEVAESVSLPDTEDALDVHRFIEKPDQLTAQALLTNKNIFWNCGIFVFRAKAMAALFQLLQPEIWNFASEAIGALRSRSAALHLAKEPYEKCPSLPFDKAIVEHTPRMKMMAARFDWRDMGSWQSLYEASAKDKLGNVLSDAATVIHCKRVFVRSDVLKVKAHRLKDVAIVVDQEGVSVSALSPQAPCNLIDWWDNSALPFWLRYGADWQGEGFHERLSFEGEPVDAPKRLRTMARQTWTFAQAAKLASTPDVLSIALHGANYLLDRVTREYSLYDLSMIRLAASALFTLAPNMAVRLAQTVAAQIDRMQDQSSFATEDRMHLLDSHLAWHRASGDVDALNAARELVLHFRSQVFDEENWTVPEGRDNVWRPGHHYEWICLLSNYEELTGFSSASIRRKLWTTARSNGTSPHTGLPYGGLKPTGAVTAPASRIWMQCEAIRAAHVMLQDGLPDVRAIIDHQLACLRQFHIEPTSGGSWIDEVSKKGDPQSGSIAASCCYHVSRSISVLRSISDTSRPHTAQLEAAE